MAERDASSNSMAREEWIQKQLKLRIKEFSEAKPVHIFTGTWNVNAGKPVEDLIPWLITDPVPDVYVVGLQEMVDLKAGNLIKDNAMNKPWEDKIIQTLSENQKSKKYQLVASKHMVGVALFVFASRDILGHVSDVQTDTVGVGVMGVGGNKGAVSIRFQLYDSQLCFVCAHLAAHMNQVLARNNDYHNCCKRLSFVKDRSKPKSHLNCYDIFQHEFLYWLGDLNYRINNTDLDLVYQKIKNKDWAYLTKLDQLIVEKANGNAFAPFTEGPINFAPTYKYLPGEHHYDRDKKGKLRVPAWCDRVLYKGDDCRQLFYRRSELLTSDHKPVSSLFQIQAKMLENHKKQVIYESLGRQLDVWENEHIPKVRMTPKCVDFGNVNFNTPVTLSLRVHNIGQVVVYFSFSPKFQDDAYCKPWLSVQPNHGTVPPGTTQDIDVTVHVTKETAHSLNSEQDTLEDILILRLKNGRDYFVTVSGDYLKSSFGASVDWLVKATTPVRFVEPKAVTEHLRVPKELWRLINFIYSAEGGTEGMQTPNLFSGAGNLEETESIRESLDTGQHFGKCSVHSMADALIQFLSQLHTSVFPMALCEEYNADMNMTGFCRHALMQLPANHYSVFIYTIAFLKECLKYTSKNKLTVDQLVVVFSRALMQPQAMHATSTTAKNSRAMFWHFLTSDAIL